MRTCTTVYIYINGNGESIAVRINVCIVPPFTTMYNDLRTSLFESTAIDTLYNTSKTTTSLDIVNKVGDRANRKVRGVVF